MNVASFCRAAVLAGLNPSVETFDAGQGVPCRGSWSEPHATAEVITRTPSVACRRCNSLARSPGSRGGFCRLHTARPAPGLPTTAHTVLGLSQPHASITFDQSTGRLVHDVKPANMLSGILIFNQKGENLIFRAFRNDCRPRLADVFRIQVISNAQVRSPILTLGSTTFSHVKHENIYLVAITKSNANAALVFEFLYRLIQLGRGYFGKFDEEAVKNNFVLVYELLDGISTTICVADTFFYSLCFGILLTTWVIQK